MKIIFLSLNLFQIYNFIFISLMLKNSQFFTHFTVIITFLKNVKFVSQSLYLITGPNRLPTLLSPIKGWFYGCMVITLAQGNKRFVCDRRRGPCADRRFLPHQLLPSKVWGCAKMWDWNRNLRFPLPDDHPCWSHRKTFTAQSPWHSH